MRFEEEKKDVRFILFTKLFDFAQSAEEEKKTFFRFFAARGITGNQCV